MIQSTPDRFSAVLDRDSAGAPASPAADGCPRTGCNQARSLRAPALGREETIGGPGSYLQLPGTPVPGSSAGARATSENARIPAAGETESTSENMEPPPASRRA